MRCYWYDESDETKLKRDSEMTMTMEIEEGAQYDYMFEMRGYTQERSTCRTMVVGSDNEESSLRMAEVQGFPRLEKHVTRQHSVQMPALRNFSFIDFHRLFVTFR